jgi:hypothetical protein
MCTHYSNSRDGSCSICLGEKARRYEDALNRIVNRTWELGDYLPREVLEDIMRIANNALKGSR